VSRRILTADERTARIITAVTPSFATDTEKHDKRAACAGRFFVQAPAKSYDRINPLVTVWRFSRNLCSR
jgi:hypothetical protein